MVIWISSTQHRAGCLEGAQESLIDDSGVSQECLFFTNESWGVFRRLPHFPGSLECSGIEATSGPAWQITVLSHSVMSYSLRPHGLYSLPGSSVHEDSPGKNTGVGCHAFLQGIFPTQGSNPGLPQCRILYRLSHQGSPWPDKFLVVNCSTPGGRAGNKFCSRTKPDAIQSWNPMHVLEKD